MNEEQVKKILKADQEAQKSYELAVKNAELIPLQAEARTKSLLEMAKYNAEVEAKAILDHARNDLIDPLKNQKAEEEIKIMESSAAINMDNAVQFVFSKLMDSSKAK